MEPNKNTYTGIVILLRYAAVIFSLIFIGIYIFVALSRIRYPFELEWMEGASVIHVKRILEGKPLYIRPQLEFVPYYTPLYYYISALIALFSGIGFFPLRFVSFVSSLGCFSIIYHIVKKETGNVSAGIISAGLFAATFNASGAWFDIARVDTLFLFLLLTAAYLIKFKPAPNTYILAGVIICLSFLTKQSAFPISLSLILYAVLFQRRLCLYFIIPYVIFFFATTLLLNYIHQGWYVFYIFELPGKHLIIKEMIIKFWTRDILSPMFISCILGIAFLISTYLKDERKKSAFYILFGIGMIGASWVVRFHEGGWINNLMPAHAFLSIMLGLGFHAFSFPVFPIPGKRIAILSLLVVLFCLIQFAVLFYDPVTQIPTRKDREAGQYLVETIKNIKGEIFIPYHSFLAEMAGKKSYLHAYGIFVITRGEESVKRSFINEIQTALREQRFAAVILDTTRLLDNFEMYYSQERVIFGDPNVFWPVTGMKTRPEFLFVPHNR